MDYEKYRDGIKRKGDKIGMEYEDIVSMLTLPETIAQSLLLLPGVGDCAIVLESVSMLTMSSYSYSRVRNKNFAMYGHLSRHMEI